VLISFLPNVETGSGALGWPSMQSVPGALSLGPELGHSAASSAEVKNGEVVPALPRIYSCIMLLSTGTTSSVYCFTTLCWALSAFSVS
jgi:hypothetical protein